MDRMTAMQTVNFAENGDKNCWKLVNRKIERSLETKATFEKLEAMDRKKLNMKKTKYMYTFKC